MSDCTSTEDSQKTSYVNKESEQEEKTAPTKTKAEEEEEAAAAKQKAEKEAAAAKKHAECQHLFKLEMLIQLPNIDNLKVLLETFDFHATDRNCRNCALIATMYTTSSAYLQLVFDKTAEKGGPELLKKYLGDTDDRGKTCLTNIFENKKAPADCITFMLDKLEEVGGVELLKYQLVNATTTLTKNNEDNYGNHFLLRSACAKLTITLDILKRLTDKIVEAGGTNLLKSHLAATKRENSFNCVFAIFGNAVASEEVVEFILQKIIEVNGPDELKTQFSAVCDLYEVHEATPLMCLCNNPSFSHAKMKIVFDKVMEVGGPGLLNNLLSATREREGYNALILVVQHPSTSVETVKFLFEKSIDAGGPDLLRTQLDATSESDGKKFIFEIIGDCLLPEVAKLIATVFFHFDVFQERYDAIDDDDIKETLKESVGIDSSSWTPDAESMSEVKKILEGSSAAHNEN